MRIHQLHLFVFRVILGFCRADNLLQTPIIGKILVQFRTLYMVVTGERHEREAGMIEFSGESDPKARLSCQIRVTEEIDGLVVHTPESKYS
jgi:hypothetical protein